MAAAEAAETAEASPPGLRPLEPQELRREASGASAGERRSGSPTASAAPSAPRLGPVLSRPSSPKAAGLAPAGGDGTTACPEAGWNSRKIPAICAVMALVCFGVTFIEAQILRKFTPVYTETECGEQIAELDDFSISFSRIEISMNIKVQCRNPNPYAIEILQATPGDVFTLIAGSAGEDPQKVHLGKLSVNTGSHLKEEGTGTVSVRMHTAIEGDTANQLFPHFVSDTSLPVMMQLQFTAGVHVSFNGIGWSMAAPFKKACGLRMTGVLVNRFLSKDEDERTSRLGPLQCAKDFDALVGQLRPVGEKSETPNDGNMGFTAAQVAPGEVWLGEIIKTASLGVSMVLSTLTGFLLLAAALAGSAHAGGSRGLAEDMGGSCCSLRLLFRHAWNGLLAAVSACLAFFGVPFSAEGWRFGPEQLVVPRAAPGDPQASCCSALAAEARRCSCWAVWPAAKDRMSGVVVSDERAADGGRWLRRLLLLRDCAWTASAAVAADAGEGAPKKAGWFSTGYHRLSTVASDPPDPESRGRRQAERPSTQPLLVASSARHAQMMEAPLRDAERPRSPGASSADEERGLDCLAGHRRAQQRQLSRTSLASRTSAESRPRARSRGSSLPYPQQPPERGAASSAGSAASDQGSCSPQRPGKQLHRSEAFDKDAHEDLAAQHWVRRQGSRPARQPSSPRSVPSPPHASL